MRPPDPLRAAAPDIAVEGGDKIPGGEDRHQVTTVVELAEHEAAIADALDSWRRSAPPLAELSDSELVGAARLLAELDGVAS